MKPIDLEIPGVTIRGALYREDDPATSRAYLLGDVLEADLPDGHTLDVTWTDDGDPGGPFLVSTYRECWGDGGEPHRLKAVDEVVAEIRRLVARHQGPAEARPDSADPFATGPILTSRVDGPAPKIG